jgi:hypothetical protein
MDIELKVFEAANFIDDHPAFAGYSRSGEGSLCIGRWKACKNGVSWEPGGNPRIYLYDGDERYDEFESDEDGEVCVGYREYYGYDWEYDHVETWIEGGNCFWEKVDSLHHNWHSIEINGERWFDDYYHDYELDVSGESYGHALIKFAEKVKEKYGDWSVEPEVENTIVPGWIDEWNEGKGVDLDAVFPFKKNPEYVYLDQYHLNALWYWRHEGRDIGLGGPELMERDTGLKYLGIS